MKIVQNGGKKRKSKSRYMGERIIRGMKRKLGEIGEEKRGKMIGSNEVNLYWLK